MPQELPEDVAAELSALETFLATESPWVPPWTPNPRQAEFLALMCREALYGGQVGGGKSGALLLAALQYAHVPGYSAIILRRTYGELEGSDGLVEQSWRLLAQRVQDGTARYVKGERCWYLSCPGGGESTLRFGHCDNLGDEKRYQGHAFQFIGWDELTHFAESQYTWMFNRLRPGGGIAAHVPLRVRGATNPGGVGHEWVKKRYGIDDAGVQDLEKSKNQETGAARPFVPACLDDNAANIDVEQYRMSLTELDSTTRAQLEKGRWIRDNQGLVYKFNRKRNLVDAFDASRGPWRFILAIDLGTSQRKPTTAFDLLAYHEHRDVVVCVWSKALAGQIPSSIADIIADTDRDYGLEQVVVDQGGLGAGYIGEFNLRFGSMVTGAGKKTDKLGHRSLLNGALESGSLVIVGRESGGAYEGPNRDLVAELESLQWAEDGLDNAKGAADHLSDALLYGYLRCRAWASEAPATSPEHGTPAWAAEQERLMEEWADRSAHAEEGPWYEAA